MSFKEDMFNYLAAGDTEQTIVNYAGFYFNAPLWVMDQTFGIVFASKTPSSDEIRKYIEEHKAEQIHFWQQDTRMQQLEEGQKIVSHYNKYIECYVTCANICYSNGKRGYLAIFTKDDVIPDHEDIRTFQRTLELCVPRGETAVESTYESSFLLGLLEGKKQKDLIYGNTIVKKLKKEFYLILLQRIGTEGKRKYREFYCQELNQRLPNAVCAIWNQKVTILCSDPDEVLRILPELIYDMEHIRIGISRQFYNLDHVYAYARQASQALQYAIQKKEKILYYDEISTEVLTDVLEKSYLLETFCRSEILRAAEYDRCYHTQHIETIQALVDAKGSQKEAGALLGLHPNTMKYRVSQLRKLFQLDINDYQLMTELPLSLEILKRL